MSPWKHDVTAKKSTRKGGRPTDYKPEHCKTVIELAKEGKSFAQIAAALDVARSTLYAWADVHPEFSDTLTRAKELAMVWWEDMGQKGLTMDKFNAPLWAKQVSCRFRDDYTDKQEINANVHTTVTRIKRTIVKPK